MIRLIAFTTAFFLGVLITFAAEAPFQPAHDCCRAAAIEKPAERITVEYDGWEYIGEYPRVRMRVTNGLSNTISYFAHGPEAPFAQVTRNGEKIFLFHCGTGARDHYLYPEGSLSAAVGSYDLGVKPIRDSDKFTVGYYFKIAEIETSVLITSEPFTLPADLREALRKTK